MAESNLQTGEAPREEAAAAVFRRQIRFWLIVAALLALFIYVFSEILLPFVAGMVLAYFLDPVADRLERAGLSRVWATIFILFAFVVVLTVGFIILIPILTSQLTDFVARLPDYLSRLQALITGFLCSEFFVGRGGLGGYRGVRRLV